MIRKGDAILNSLDRWEVLAGPKSRNHWKDYRSAKECARAWLVHTEPFQIPPELMELLAGHEDFGEVLEWEAEPECLISFDGYGGPANVDMLLSGRDERGPFVLAIEAKADETFGRPVSRALSAALERRLRSPSSKGLDRIEELVAGVLGARRKGAPPLHQVRYQLLTLTAAALSRAKKESATRAAMIIHEFDTPETQRRKHRQNDTDLQRFLTRLGIEEPGQILRGELLGPVRVPGGGRYEDPPPLYVGKAIRRVERRAEGS